MHIFATRQCIKISVSFLSTIHQGKNMPKHAHQGRSSKEKKEASNKNDKCELKRAVFLTPKNEIYIKIHAKPGAKQNAITDVCDEAVGIQIAAPPIDGEANKELIRFLAEVLQLKKSEIYLEKGSKSREKTVVVSGLATTVDSVLSKFQFADK